MFDRTPSFAKQVEETTKAANKKLKIIAKLAYSDWGADKLQLSQLFQAIVCSKLGYAAAGWQPWCSPSQLNRLEVV